MMRDPFDAQSHASHSGWQSPVSFTPSGSSYMADSELWNSTSDSLIRNQFQGISVSRDARRDAFNRNFIDPDVAELYSISRSVEEDVLALRKQVADASTKELHLLKEKHVLERKLTDLRMALDERQSHSVSDVFRELTQRKGFIEENLRLANDIKVAEEDVYVFTSQLLSLLADYDLRPPVLSASVITNAIKRLYSHMHWKLRSSQIGVDEINNLMARQSGSMNSNHVHKPSSSSNNQFVQVQLDSNMRDHQQRSHNLGNVRFETPNQSRFIQDHEMVDARETKFTPSFDMQYPHGSEAYRDSIGVFNFLDSQSNDAVTRRAATDSQFYMPTIHETQTPSMSDGDTSLPGIDGFQIIGEAKPGCTLRACGYPTNGTSLCVFQWYRHLQDGTRQLIEGAKIPDYVVTADDVDTLLAVDCIPMDDNNNQGELVCHFANKQNKITCDPGMQNEIDTNVSAGRAIFNILLLRESSDEWDPTILLLKRYTYQIKASNGNVVIVEEKYSPDLYQIKVPPGLSTQFVLISSGGNSLPFSTGGISQPYSMENDLRLRDIIVLTMRIYQAKALDVKRKGKA